MDKTKVRLLRVALEGLEVKAEASQIESADVYELDPVQHAVAVIASRIAGRAK